MHLDGVNQPPYLTGQEPRSARKDYFYFNDDGDFEALRYENWKVLVVMTCLTVGALIRRSGSRLWLSGVRA